MRFKYDKTQTRKLQWFPHTWFFNKFLFSFAFSRLRQGKLFPGIFSLLIGSSWTWIKRRQGKATVQLTIAFEVLKTATKSTQYLYCVTTSCNLYSMCTVGV